MSLRFWHYFLRLTWPLFLLFCFCFTFIMLGHSYVTNPSDNYNKVGRGQFTNYLPWHRSSFFETGRLSFVWGSWGKTAFWKKIWIYTSHQASAHQLKVINHATVFYGSFKGKNVVLLKLKCSSILLFKSTRWYLCPQTMNSHFICSQRANIKAHINTNKYKIKMDDRYSVHKIKSCKIVLVTEMFYLFVGFNNGLNKGLKLCT